MAKKTPKTKESKQVKKEKPRLKPVEPVKVIKPDKADKPVKSVKPVKKKEVEPVPVKVNRYFEAKGSRKTAVARVRLYSKQRGVFVNDKEYKEYFKDIRLQSEVLKPLKVMNVADKLGVTVKVKGGGLTGQAEAIRHGIARTLVLFNADFRKRLRRYGLLTRDARMVERKKYGLKKARRAPQWAKR